MGHIVNIVETGRRERGSITVESSIIVPFIILCIVTAIYMGMILHQRALIQSAAETAARAGAAAWAKGLDSIETGIPDKQSLKEIKLYRRIYDPDKEDRLKQIEAYALKLATENQIIKPQDLNVKAEIRDYAILRRLEVEITKHIKVPFGKFMHLFGGSETVAITVKTTAPIDEPVELIRNTDFIIDIEKELENEYPQLKNVGDKVRDFMRSVSERLENFFN